MLEEADKQGVPLVPAYSPGKQSVNDLVCYRARDETAILDLEGRRESEDLKFSYLPYWPPYLFGRLGQWISRNAYWSWGLRQRYGE